MMCLSGEPFRRRITLVPWGMFLTRFFSFCDWVWSSIIFFNLASILALCDSSILVLFLCVLSLSWSSQFISPCLPANLSQGCYWTCVSKRPYVAFTFVLSLSSNLLDFFLMKRKNWERQIRWKKQLWTEIAGFQYHTDSKMSSIAPILYRISARCKIKNVASENLMHQPYVLSGELLFIHSIVWHTVYQGIRSEFQT